MKVFNVLFLTCMAMSFPVGVHEAQHTQAWAPVESAQQRLVVPGHLGRRPGVWAGDSAQV